MGGGTVFSPDECTKTSSMRPALHEKGDKKAQLKAMFRKVARPYCFQR
jgi:hypothetical protein